MSSSSHPALDAVDEFIKVGSEIADIPILAEPDYRSAAEDLYQIAKKLLAANETMARWLNRFLHFDFHNSEARTQFLDLVEQYRTAKTGGGLRQMKFNCGDIMSIYDSTIQPRIDDMYPDDIDSKRRARSAFEALGTSDIDMVAFIYDTVIGGIDRFLSDAEQAVDRSDLNSAEERRLTFKIESSELSERLERLGSGLSDLMLRYARLAQRRVTVD